MLTPPHTPRNGVRVTGARRTAVAAAMLVAGAAIYITARPMTLRGVSWARALGLGATLDAVRASLPALSGSLPDWCVYSLPDGLWLFSLLVALDGVWDGAGRAQVVVRSAVVAAALAHEAAQARWASLGTFCWPDVCCYAAASAAAAAFHRSGPLARSWR